MEQAGGPAIYSKVDYSAVDSPFRAAPSTPPRLAPGAHMFAPPHSPSRSCRYAGTIAEGRTLTAALHLEAGWYVAQCLEVDVASQGRTIDEALANLAEAVQLYLGEVDDPAGYVSSTPLVRSFRLPVA